MHYLHHALYDSIRTHICHTIRCIYHITCSIVLNLHSYAHRLLLRMCLNLLPRLAMIELISCLSARHSNSMGKRRESCGNTLPTADYPLRPPFFFFFFLPPRFIAMIILPHLDESNLVLPNQDVLAWFVQHEFPL